MTAVETAHGMLDTTLIHQVGISSQPTPGLHGGHYAMVGILGIGARHCYNLVRHRRLLP